MTKLQTIKKKMRQNMKHPFIDCQATLPMYSRAEVCVSLQANINPAYTQARERVTVKKGSPVAARKQRTFWRSNAALCRPSPGEEVEAGTGVFLEVEAGAGVLLRVLCRGAH